MARNYEAEIPCSQDATFEQLLARNDYLALNVGISKDEAAKLLRLKTYDTALPQGWVDRITAWGYDPRSTVVWCYDQNVSFGLPVGLTTEAHKKLEEFAEWNRKK